MVIKVEQAEQIGVNYVKEASYGEKLKQAVIKPGEWTMGLNGFGEVLPYHDNKIFLDYNKTDKWGLPTVTFDAKA